MINRVVWALGDFIMKVYHYMGGRLHNGVGLEQNGVDRFYSRVIDMFNNFEIILVLGYSSI